MDGSNYNLGVGGAGSGPGGGRRGGSGRRGRNNYQQLNQGRSGGGGGGDGYGGKRGGGGGGRGRGGTQMATNPPPAQPWGYRPVQGGTQRPESPMGQAAEATGRRAAWSAGPPRVAGRGWASAVGGRDGAGAGQAQRTDPVHDFPVASNARSTILHCSADVSRGYDGDAVSSFGFTFDISNNIIDIFLCCFI